MIIIISFFTDQLQEIRNVRMARLVCDNTDIIDTVQMYPMVLSDHELYVEKHIRKLKCWNIKYIVNYFRNPRVPCRSGVISRMDLTKWSDTSLDTAEPNTRLVSIIINCTIIIILNHIQLILHLLKRGFNNSN